MEEAEEEEELEEETLRKGTDAFQCSDIAQTRTDGEKWAESGERERGPVSSPFPLAPCKPLQNVPLPFEPEEEGEGGERQAHVRLLPSAFLPPSFEPPSMTGRRFPSARESEGQHIACISSPPALEDEGRHAMRVRQQGRA